MWCPSCGNQLKDGAKFCGACGAKLGANEATATPTSSPSTAASTAAETASSSAPASASASASAQAAPAQTAPAQPQTAGCLGTAWRDITSSPNWLKRLLLLMVMKCVPILAFFTDGYALGWAADAARGKRDALPVGNFDKRTFIRGVFYAILNVLFTIANVWLFVLNLIPFIGFIAVFVVNLFANAFFALAAVRMAVRERLGAAFDLSEMFARYKKSVGGLIGATFVPGLIVGVIFAILAIIVMVIIAFSAAASAVGTASSLMGSSYYGSSYGSSMDAYETMAMLSSLADFYSDPFGAVMGIVASLGAIISVFVIIYLFLSAFAEVWTLRAVGHWVDRNASTWGNEAEGKC